MSAKYKNPFNPSVRYTSLEKAIKAMDKDSTAISICKQHNITSKQLLFNFRNNYPLDKVYGKNKFSGEMNTEFDNDHKNGRYKDFINDEEKSKWSASMSDKSFEKTGLTHAAKDPRHQKKIEDGKQVMYTFSTGGEVSHSSKSTEELRFLKYLDLDCGYKSTFVEKGPDIYYINRDGKETLYISDFYIPSHNLVVEIKGPYHRDLATEELKQHATINTKNEHGIPYEFILIDSGDYSGFEKIMKEG